MMREDQAYPRFSRSRQQVAKECRRALFEIDEGRRRKKLQIKCPPFSCGQRAGAAFLGMPDGNNQGSTELVHRPAKRLEIGDKMIDSDFQKVDGTGL